MVPVGATGCGNAAGYDVFAGPTTSCGFALNVATGLANTGGPPSPVDAFSPTTGQSYSMRCAEPSPVVVCVGGTDATVYLN
jgi:hypothetical protein